MNLRVGLIKVVTVALAVFAFGFLSEPPQFDWTPESFFDQEGDTYGIYKDFLHEFGSERDIFILYQPKTGEAWSESNLKKLQKFKDDMAESISLTEGFSSVRNISTILDGECAGQSNDRSLEDVSRCLESKSHDLIRHKSDAHYAIIRLKTNFYNKIEHSSGSDDLDIDFGFDETKKSEFKSPRLKDYKEFKLELDRIIDRSGWSRHNHYWLAGNAILMAWFNDFVRSDIPLYFALSLLLTGMVLFFLFSSLLPVIGLCVLVLSVCGVGSLVSTFFGLQVNAMIIASLVLVVCMSGSFIVFLYNSVAKSKVTAMNVQDSSRAIKTFIIPFFLATGTTIISASTLLFTNIKALQIFGVTTVVLLVALVFICVPVGYFILIATKPKSTRKNPFIDYLTTKVLEAVEFFKTKSTMVLIVFTASFLVAILGVYKLTIKTDWYELADPKVKAISDYKHIESVIGSTTSLELVFTGKPYFFVESAFVQRLEDVDAHIQASPLFNEVKSYSFLNLFREVKKRSEKKLSGMEKTLLLENSGSSLVHAFISSDKTRIRFSIPVENEDNSVYERMQKELLSLSADFSKYYEGVQLTGGPILMMEASLNSQRQQRFAITTSFALMAVLIFIIFRTFWLSMLVITVNIFPSLVVLGALGWMGVSLDSESLSFVPIALGISIDDSMHFFVSYRDAKNKGVGGDSYERCTMVIRNIGPSLMTTTIILVVGLMTFYSLDYLPLKYFGLSIVGSLLVAIVLDLIFVPVIINRFKL